MKNKRVLAIDPVSRRFGYAVLEWPLILVDWGVKSTRKQKKEKTLTIISKLVKRYHPTVIVLEDCSNARSRRCPRIEKLIGSICRYAVKENIAVRVFSRSQVRQVFDAFGAITKYEIAHAISRQLPELVPRLPRYRKPWMSEDYRMALFNATALALTYRYTYREPKKKY